MRGSNSLMNDHLAPYQVEKSPTNASDSPNAQICLFYLKERLKIENLRLFLVQVMKPGPDFETHRIARFWTPKLVQFRVSSSTDMIPATWLLNPQNCTFLNSQSGTIQSFKLNWNYSSNSEHNSPSSLIQPTISTWIMLGFTNRTMSITMNFRNFLYPCIVSDTRTHISGTWITT